MKIEKEQLLSIIPHRGRMLLISRVVNYSGEEKSIEAEFEITEDCLFYDSGFSGVPVWAGFEFIAQAISAFVGIRDIVKKIRKTGYILGISNMRMELPFFKIGSIITIKAKEAGGMDPVYIFDGQILLDGKIAVEGKLTVMDVYEENIN